MKIVTKGIALVAALVMVLTAMPLAVFATGTDAQTGNSATAADVISSAAADESGYTAYQQGAPAPGAASITVAADAYAANASSGVTPQQDQQYGTVYRLDDQSTASFTVNVPADGVYTVSPLFGNIVSTAEMYEIGFMIDGAYPFAACEELAFNVLWEDDGEIRELSNGDQVPATQKQVAGIVSRPLEDVDGIVRSPYEFKLTAGTHVLSVTAKGREFLLAGLRLDPPERLKSYEEVSAGYGNYNKYTGTPIVIEAEDAYIKSGYALSAKSDPSTADVTPHDAYQSLINYIGGDTWGQTGQEITWKVDVPETGLYKLGFAFKQGTITNGSVYRWLKVDGKTPFIEASEIGFGYDVGWQFQTLGEKDDEGKPVRDYLIYLEEGTRIFSLSVTLSDIAEVFARMEEIVASLGDLYLDIVMITSDNPDANRDYELHKQIPDFVKILESNKEKIDKLEGELGNTLKANGELNGALKNMSRVIGEMLGSMYEAHLQVSTYYNAHQTLSAWLYDIKKMTLSLDQMILGAPDEEMESSAAGFWEGVLFDTMRFFNSFRDTYSGVASGDDSMPTIKLWVNWGRDQVKVLNTLIQDSFTPQNNVNVVVEQVNASLVQGLISGKSPDLYLHMARTEPVNLAMRGVLYDLKNFEDYEQVLNNFHPGAEVPYLYRDGCYALPDTQGFFVMFYRKDILDELGVAVPKTWSDFTQATGILQRNNMNTYLPYTKMSGATTVNTGAGGLSIYPTMLMQRGGEIYNKEQNATDLSSHVAIDTFTFWTDFYTKYSLDQEANFFQKFRVGTMPLGIAGYTQYLTFKVAAPEIDGKWGMAEIPGYVQEDGTISNVCAGSGSACAIMKNSKDKEAAWKFMKWWVSADTQYRYSAECEAILGESGRTSSATMEAVSRLSWDRDAIKVIESQWQKVVEVPEVPGSYFVSRSIDQAFWATKNGESSSKEALLDWAEISDKEIERKIEEYANVDPDGE